MVEIADYLKKAFKNGGQLVAFIVLLLALKSMNLLPLKAEDFQSWSDYVMIIIMLGGLVISFTSFLLVSIMAFTEYFLLKKREMQWKLEHYNGEKITLSGKMDTSIIPLAKTLVTGLFPDKVELSEEEKLEEEIKELESEL